MQVPFLRYSIIPSHQKFQQIRDEIATKNISLELCRDPDQTADILTKSLSRPKHQKHVYEMGLANIIHNN